MLYRKAQSVLLILLTVLGTAIVLSGFVPSLPTVVPGVHATPPGNYGILGLFSEQFKTNAVVQSLAINTLVTFDVNVTDVVGGLSLKGFDINFTFASSQITYAGSAFGTVSNSALVSCPASQGCLLDGLNVVKNTNGTGTGGNSYRLSVVDEDQARPTVAGTGILFRIRFKTVAATVVSGIHITANSILENPSSIPYTPIDGYIDSRATPTNYNIAVNVATTTIIRPVSQFQTNSTGSTVSVTLSTSGTFPASVTLKAWSLPLTGSTCTFTPSGGTYACPTTGCTYPTPAFTTILNVSSLPTTPPALKYIHVLLTTTGTYSQTSVTIPTETVIAGSLQVDFILKNDPKIKFVDSIANGHWDPGEPVVYDGDNSATFNAASQTLKTDAKIKFQDKNLNGHWEPGEPVVYDNNADNKYNFGKFNNDTVVAGATPTNNTALVADTHFKFFGPGAAWATGNSIAYDANANNLFDTGDTLIYGNTLDAIISGSPANLATLVIDSLIRYYDPTGLGYWLNSAVAYDGNNNSIYDVGLTIPVTLIKTHDAQVTTVVQGNRGFGYNGVSLSGTAQLNVNVAVTK